MLCHFSASRSLLKPVPDPKGLRRQRVMVDGVVVVLKTCP